MTIEEMQEYAVSLGEKSYRGRQLFQWVWKGSPAGLSAMLEAATDLPKGFKEKIGQTATMDRVKVIDIQEDRKDGTRKFLFGLGSEAVEGVLMKYRYGNTLCVSSQIGCKMGCTFCASALGGFVRDLSAGEMAGQIIAAEEASGEKIDHIVIMGMGEPFDNYDNVAKFLRLIHEPAGRKMSWRNMTVSTSGVIPGIVAFSRDFPQVNLAISLHRANDEARSRLMPVNRKYPLDKLMKAARDYTEKTHRRITFEYALISGENDRDEDIDELIVLLSGMLCHVNLIPLNEVEETGLAGTDRKRAEEFAARLEAAGIPTTLRRKLGDSISGACGQLRLQKKDHYI